MVILFLLGGGGTPTGTTRNPNHRKDNTVSDTTSTTTEDQTGARPDDIAQGIADVVINLVRFLGPDPAAIVRKDRPQG
jgi:pantothenate synthetase